MQKEKSVGLLHLQTPVWYDPLIVMHLIHCSPKLSLNTDQWAKNMGSK